MSRARNARSRSKARIVHHTHHLCREMGIGSREVKPDYSMMIGYREHSEPRFFAPCHDSRSCRWSTDWAAVTCRKCPSIAASRAQSEITPGYFGRSLNLGIEAADRTAYERVAPDDHQTWLAWLACCRHVGAPSPRSPKHTARALAEVERCDLARSVESLRPSPFGFNVFAGERGAASLTKEREQLLVAVSKLREDERLASAEAVADLLVAFDISEEVHRLVTNAHTAISSLATRLLNEGPVALAGSIQSTHAEVN